MKFGSVFSGIGGFDLGFERAGMECAWMCEIDKQAQEVLKKHWRVSIIEDAKDVNRKTAETVDLICGGFPCQDVSIAGKREGLAGKRSGLWFEFARIINEFRPGWVVIENVCGLLSSNQGRDFATILQWLVECGYGVCWRVFDSQHFGVPQRHRRIFIVGSLGNGHSAEVLFESESSKGDSSKNKESWKENTARIDREFADAGKQTIVMAHGQSNAEIAINICPTLTVNHEQPIIWEMSHASEGVRMSENIFPTLQARMGTGGNQVPLVGIRRLMPIECERLQGFPDRWTEGLSDTARYRLLGNAVTVNVAEWIGKRIVEIERGKYERR